MCFKKDTTTIDESSCPFLNEETLMQYTNSEFAYRFLMAAKVSRILCQGEGRYDIYFLFLLLLIFNELRNGNSKKVSFLWILSSFLFPVVPFFYVIRVIVRKMKHDSCWLAQDNKEYPWTLRKDALFLKSDDKEVCYVFGWREDTLSLASKDMTLLLTRQWPYNAKQARFNR